MEVVSCWVYWPPIWINNSSLFISICHRATRKTLQSSKHQTEGLFTFSRKFCIWKACIVTEVAASLRKSFYPPNQNLHFHLYPFQVSEYLSVREIALYLSFYRICLPWSTFSRSPHIELELQASDTSDHCFLRLQCVQFSEICGF